VCGATYARHQEAVAAGVPTVLGDYAATNPAEFFAVATERYFLAPAALAAAHPGLAAIFDDYYRAERGPDELTVIDHPDGFTVTRRPAARA
jgi:Mlc titration factor MtfA (ptsG expression regulator)